MSTRVDELVQAINTLSEQERGELLIRLAPRPLTPVDELRRQYDGLWVALEIPEDEDSDDPKYARLIAFGETDEAAYKTAEA